MVIFLCAYLQQRWMQSNENYVLLLSIECHSCRQRMGRAEWMIAVPLWSAVWAIVVHLIRHQDPFSHPLHLSGRQHCCNIGKEWELACGKCRWLWSPHSSARYASHSQAACIYMFFHLCRSDCKVGHNYIMATFILFYLCLDCITEEAMEVLSCILFCFRADCLCNQATAALLWLPVPI